ncbi:MAG TPA: hypothetical protein PKH07_03940 [bacterium]|nr:hypothetical protein [bacterium]
MRIIVVEPEKESRPGISDFLSGQGYLAQPVRHFEDALRRIEQSRGEVDVVFSGCSLELETSSKMFKVMNAFFPSVTLLLKVQDLCSVQACQALDSGVRAFIQEPVSHGELLSLLKQIEDHRRRRRILRVPRFSEWEPAAPLTPEQKAEMLQTATDRKEESARQEGLSAQG